MSCEEAVTEIFKMFDKIAYPMGTVLRIRIEKNTECTLEKLLPNNPKKFFEALTEITLGDKLSSETLLLILFNLISRKYNLKVNSEELINAIKNDNSKYVKNFLKNLAKILKIQ